LKLPPSIKNVPATKSNSLAELAKLRAQRRGVSSTPVAVVEQEMKPAPFEEGKIKSTTKDSKILNSQSKKRTRD